MLLNKTFLAAAATAVCAFSASAVCDWENTSVNSKMRLPPRTYSMPLANAADAFSSGLEPDSPYSMSLNGIWKIKWVGDPSRRPDNFWAPGYDVSNWNEIDVPSCVEMRGFGSPGYTNVRYPHKNEWPKIRNRITGKDDYNPVSSYRRNFKLPKSWQDRRIILRFDGVYSAYYVWINGELAGYAEDSKLPSEFDITPFVGFDKENSISVQVFRWCDGSYLEDQDMFRFSGIFRDVTVWSMPHDGIWDFSVSTKALDGSYTSWNLSVAAPNAESVELYGADGKLLSGLSKIGNDVFSADLRNISPWSAEKPALYTLLVKGRSGDIRAKRIGFKEQKIAGNMILVNGRAVKFKGVNRHETDPENGRTVSLELMVKDIEMMKRANINTVRTCHYPDHHLWYDLCDKYGIYVVAEANVEGHEPGYGKAALGLFKEWEHTIVERNVRHVLFYRNNPCVTLWSMGNETGHGRCFKTAIAEVKKIDSSRPVHWERGNVDADVDSTMYPSVEWLNERGKLGDGLIDDKSMDRKNLAKKNGGDNPTDHTRLKAFFMCEYAHAMGNAMGNFKEYWDVFYTYKSLSGGCIWDWVDQSVWKYTGRIDRKTSKPERFLAYGGDFDEDPNDGPFCNNGVIDAERNVTAKLVEVAHVHRNLVVKPAAGAYRFKLVNRFAFTNANEFDGRWELLVDGNSVAQGEFAVPDVKPLSEVEFSLDALANAVAKAKRGKEYFVNFRFQTKSDELWAKKGFAVARDQIALKAPAQAKEVEPPAADSVPEMLVSRYSGHLYVQTEKSSAVFDCNSGLMLTLSVNGVAVFDSASPEVVAGPRLTCLRARVDNDKWMSEGKTGWRSSGLTQLHYHSGLVKIEGNTVKTVVDVSGAKGCGFTHTCDYVFNAGGSVTVKNKSVPYGSMPHALPRLGLSMLLPGSFENIRYYGCGPRENYIDRCSASFAGIYSSTVEEQYEPYSRPQDNGYKTGVRWVEFTDASGRGVKFSSPEQMFMQALHYDMETLDNARHVAGERRRNAPLERRDEVCLNLDIRQTGLGGASCGPATMDKYRFDPNAPVAWEIKIEAVK